MPLTPELQALPAVAAHLRLASVGTSDFRGKYATAASPAVGAVVLSLTLDQKESELLYALADERLGRASTIITSNRPPEDWYNVFPDPVIGGAILDRLVSEAIKVLVVKGRSYRKEGSQTSTDPIDNPALTG